MNYIVAYLIYKRYEFNFFLVMTLKWKSLFVDVCYVRKHSIEKIQINKYIHTINHMVTRYQNLGKCKDSSFRVRVNGYHIQSVQTFSFKQLNLL